MAGGFPSPLSVWDQCRVPQPCWRRAEMALGTRCAGSWAWCRGAFLALTLRLGASALPLLLAEVCSEPASSAAPRDSVRGPVQCWGLLEHPSCCDHLFPTFSSFGQEIFAGASRSSVASRGAAWATGLSPFPSWAWSCLLFAPCLLVPSLATKHCWRPCPPGAALGRGCGSPSCVAQCPWAAGAVWG